MWHHHSLMAIIRDGRKHEARRFVRPRTHRRGT
jgi:hypothetical protein